MICLVCGYSTEHFGCSTILKSHKAEFRRCLKCGLLFAENPVWLGEAYSSALTFSDLGLVDRNIWFSKVAASLISIMFDSNGRFIDYAGGTGLFTRLMRDAGFDYYWHDINCNNVFAEDFVVNSFDGERFELLTAMELFEHLTAPQSTISDLCKLSTNILFTTLILPEPAPNLNQWWYYGLEHGQHITFYTSRSLRVLAEQSGLQLSSNSSNVHLFSEKRLPNTIFKLFTHPSFSTALMLLMKRRSLLFADYEQVLKKQQKL